MMRILFVDDEPRVLEGIERQLFAYDDDWDMVFVESGAAALDELAKAPFDVLVTDMRMPGMDGATLLKHVQQRFPRVVRIVLSGHSEFSEALRAMPIAHQFLSKPCQPERLRDVLTRACQLQSVLADKALRELIGEVGDLPARPRVFSELNRTLADENSSLDDIARIVEQDMAISSKVLHIANTAFFAAAKRIHSLREATSRLGANLIRNLALSCEVFRELEGPARGVFSIDELHGHALLVARIAREILQGDASKDDAFMAGLLHDVGMLVLASKHPEHLIRAARETARRKCPLATAERELLGTTHAEIGAYLLGLWGFPYPVTEAVAHHHAPERIRASQASRSEPDVATAIFLADRLALERQPYAGGLVSDCEPTVNEALLAEIGLQSAADLERWREIAGRALGG